MNINLDTVTEKFKLYSGEPLDGAEPLRDDLCRELCGESTKQIKLRARPEVLEDEESDTEPLASLAAAEAFCQLAALDEASAPRAVNSTEMKIQLGDRVDAAQRLRAGKEAACRGLLREEGFYFGTA